MRRALGCTLVANLEDLRMIQPLLPPTRVPGLQPCFDRTKLARGSRGRQSSRVSQTEADDIDHTKSTMQTMQTQADYGVKGTHQFCSLTQEEDVHQELTSEFAKGPIWKHA